ncbi:MAG: hypothetical protein ABR608_13925 [Pseudonocardiaceae bacterium]
MLEPVLNLARLQIRASDGEQALRLLTSMYRAVMTNTDLVVDGHTLPLTDLTGTRHEHHKLREWVWLRPQRTGQSPGSAGWVGCRRGASSRIR